VSLATFDIRDVVPAVLLERQRILLGIDPGLSGALAWFWPAANAVRAEDMPRVGKEVDAAQLAAWLRDARPAHAFLESAGSRPGQGVSSTFTTGANFGVIKGVLAAVGIPYTFVSPARWKRDMRLSKDKAQSRALAIRAWPESDCFRRVKDHGRAEAALIALWGSRQANG
jgi:hypothetical protein